jgi:hypothetical protein
MVSCDWIMFGCDGSVPVTFAGWDQHQPPPAANLDLKPVFRTCKVQTCRESSPLVILGDEN